MANTYLTRNLASTNTSWTFSAWVKRERFDLTNYLISWGNSGTDGTGILFAASGELAYYSESSPDNKYRITSAKYRDVNGWYHVVCKCDSNAITLYVNGEEPTQSWSVGSSANPLDTSTMAIGKWVTSNYYHHGSMAHVHFIDGTAYNPSTFGETDSTTGIWKPKTNPSVTYGSNGFFLDFANSSDMGNDISGNNNDFTVSGGTITQTIDTPSNVFATWNALGPFRLGGGSIRKGTFSNGNTTIAMSSSTYVETVSATLAVSSGKWYWEVKPTANVNQYGEIGIKSTSANGNNFNGDSGHPSMIYKYDGTKNYNTIDGTSYGNSYTNNDIIGIALDLDNKAIWFSKNGTWQNSATQTEIENGTTTNAAFSGTSSSDGFPSTSSTYTPYVIGGDSGGAPTFQANFGNGYFGTTAVASAGTNSGIGTFEYDVPSGYKALCTKNINAEEYS